MITYMRGLAVVVSIGVVGSACGEEAQETPPPYYQGKNITFLVGFGPNGGYDTYARLTAKYLTKHIPGNPTWQVENVPSNGSLDAANSLYNDRAPDGLTIGSFNMALTIQDAIDNPDVAFESAGFGWVGSPTQGNIACAIMGFTGVRDWAGIAASSTSLRFGASAKGSTTYDIPSLLSATAPDLTTDFTIVQGYSGSATILAGLRNREADGVCLSWDSMKSTARAMLDATGDDQLIPFAADGNIRSDDAETQGLPSMESLLTDADHIQALRAWLGGLAVERALAVPPGTPAEQLAILRTAYVAALADPELLAEAADPDGDPGTNDGLPIIPSNGADVASRVAEIVNISDVARTLLQSILL